GQTAVALVEKEARSRGADAPGPGWPLFRGDAGRRSVSVRGDVPFLEPNWRQATIPERKAGGNSEEVEALWRAGPESALARSVPVLADGKVVFRTHEGLRAVDLRSREIHWESVGFSGSLYTLIVSELSERAQVREWLRVYSAGPDRGRQLLFENSLLGT